MTSIFFTKNLEMREMQFINLKITLHVLVSVTTR